MALLPPSENRNIIDSQKSSLVDVTLEYCNERIQEAMRMGNTTVRVCTDIDYGDYNSQWGVESGLAAAGYRYDSEMQVRHGLVIDIMWDEQ